MTERISGMSPSSIRDVEPALDGDHDLQRIDGVQAQAHPEEQAVVRDLAGLPVEVEALHQRLLETAGQFPAPPGEGARFSKRDGHQT